jgi:hypothetical protein
MQWKRLQEKIIADHNLIETVYQLREIFDLLQHVAMRTLLTV